MTTRPVATGGGPTAGYELDFVSSTAPASYHRGRWRGLMRRGDVGTPAPVLADAPG